MGKNVTGKWRNLLADLAVDVQLLSVDLTQINNAIHRTLKDVQADASAVTSALASNTDATVQADVSAMNTDLSAVASDIASHKPAFIDLGNLSADVLKLTSDLGTGATQAVEQQLQDLSNDLLELAIELTALRV